MLSRFTLIDYDREMALVAVVRDRSAGADGTSTEIDRIVGVSRYVITPDQQGCEFSLVVAEDMKGRGLGDCGTRRTYVWDGARFRLTFQAQMDECRGSIDWIPTWRARAVRR